jgi:hypothetical protein
MFEIPLAVRYDITSGQANKWFIKAGSSSYLMKKEDYQYKTERYGVYYNGNRTYENSSNTLFSVLHLSGGYETHLGKNILVRIEPYLKLPIQGVGVGEMSLRSTGFNIGITKPIR